MDRCWKTAVLLPALALTACSGAPASETPDLQPEQQPAREPATDGTAWGMRLAVRAEAAPAEEHSGSLGVDLTLSPRPYSAVTVEYLTEDGTATAGADYRSSKGRVRFNPGETHQRIEIPLIDDDKAEPDESFYLLLHADGRATVDTPELTLTILDDD